MNERSHKGLDDVPTRRFRVGEECPLVYDLFALAESKAQQVEPPEGSEMLLDHLEVCLVCRRRFEAALAEELSRVPVGNVIPLIAEYISLESSERKRIDALVYQSFRAKQSAADIINRLREQERVSLNAEQICNIVQHLLDPMRSAGNKIDVELGKRLRERCNLQAATAVRGTELNSIIWSAAAALKDLISAVPGKSVRVGLAGGPATLSVVSACCHLLDHDGFDGEVDFRPLGIGPVVLPASYIRPDWPQFRFSNIWEGTADLKETSFGGQFVPATIPIKKFEELLKHDGMRQVVDSVYDLNILLTSGAVWDDPHSALLLKRFENLEVRQKATQLVGELLWHPIGCEPVEMNEVPLTALGPTGLKRLPELIKKGVRVMAVLGPCGKCRRPKTPLVKAVLQKNPAIITDIFLDVVAAEEVVRELSQEQQIRKRTTG